MCQQSKLTRVTITRMVHRQNEGDESVTMDTTTALLKDSLIASLSAVNNKSPKNKQEPGVESSTASSSPLDSSLHPSPSTISGPVYSPIAIDLNYTTLPRLPGCKPLHYDSLEEIGVSAKAVASTSVGTSNSNASGHVSFETVEIRRYPMILGDNPSCRYGCPVSLGWEYEEIPTISVDDYEDYRMKQRPRRQGKQLYQLILNYYQRKDIFGRMGLDRNELKQREREMLKIQRQRSRTAMMSPLFKVEDVARSVGRKVQRAFVKRRQRHSEEVEHHNENEGAYDHSANRQHSHCDHVLVFE
jgi:hypothetical protein